MPSKQQWSELERLVATKPDALFIWEDEPAIEILNRMANMGLASVVIRPAANISNKDWLSEQQANLKRLQDSARNSN